MPGTNLDVGQLSRSNGSSADWTALEEAFFAAAPPDVAVQPPPPPSFDDLGPSVSDRPRPRTERSASQRAAERQRVEGDRVEHEPRLLASRLAMVRGPLERGLRLLVSRLVMVRAPLGRGLRALASRLAQARRTLERELRARGSRLASEPPEWADGKTLASAVAALVVLCGLSASVLGSRSATVVRGPAVAPVAASLANAPAAAPLANAPAAAPLANAAPSGVGPELAPSPTNEAPTARASHASQRSLRSRHAIVRSAKRHRTSPHAAPRPLATSRAHVFSR
jgi:hypothetical protein